jgi:hypothetical protein
MVVVAVVVVVVVGGVVGELQWQLWQQGRCY